jgi:DNA-binding GntR family transcriptional regulator
MDIKVPSYSQPERAQLRDNAGSYIRELIISGNAPPGHLLRLDPLALQLGMSPTPVREALLLLAQTGWVVLEPHRGFRVARFQRSDVEDTYYVSRFLSGELAARAAVNILDQHIERLYIIDQAIEQASREGALDKIYDGNSELHRVIYDQARSPRILAILDVVAAFVPKQFWGAVPGWIEHNRTGHAPIIHALHAHDPESSRALMEAHIDDSSRLLGDYFDRAGLFEA